MYAERGLYLRVTQNGTKTGVFLHAQRPARMDGSSTTHTFGLPMPALEPTDARQRMMEWTRLTHGGRKSKGAPR